MTAPKARLVRYANGIFFLWRRVGGEEVRMNKVWAMVLLGVISSGAAPAKETNPYDDKAVAATAWPIPVYTPANAPATPKLDALPLKQSITQYGITWTFARSAHVGQFINGDWYVVAPVTIKSIDPQPLYGNEIPDNELDSRDKEIKQSQRIRNGFMLNPPAQMKVAYDSGVRNFFDPSLIQKLPVMMKAGDSLVSTISMPIGLVLHTQIDRNTYQRGEEDASPTRAAAVLTCVDAPLPGDA